MNIFESFETGKLSTYAYEKNFSNVDWSKHPTFSGVYLKHLITGKETDGAYSYHLVKIEPNMSIDTHIHETQLETHEVICGSGVCINNNVSIEYYPGIISIFPAGIEHSVKANEQGLFLFAKFIPALC